MRLNTSLSSALHALLHLDGQQNAVTSEALAECLGTNAVVVRRFMGRLRKAGLVSSEKGHSGGWRLREQVDQITVFHVYKALGSPTLFAIGHQTAGCRCPALQSVHTALDDVLIKAETMILTRFSRISLTEIAASWK